MITNVYYSQKRKIKQNHNANGIIFIYNNLYINKEKGKLMQRNEERYNEVSFDFNSFYFINESLSLSVHMYM